MRNESIWLSMALRSASARSCKCMTSIKHAVETTTAAVVRREISLSSRTRDNAMSISFMCDLSFPSQLCDFSLQYYSHVNDWFLRICRSICLLVVFLHYRRVELPYSFHPADLLHVRLHCDGRAVFFRIRIETGASAAKPPKCCRRVPRHSARAGFHVRHRYAAASGFHGADHCGSWGTGGRLATVLSALALAFSGLSFYESVLKTAELEVYVPPVIHYARDQGGQIELFAVPITIVNSGARTGTALTMELTVENLRPDAPVKTKRYYSAFIGEHSPKDDEINRGVRALEPRRTHHVLRYGALLSGRQPAAGAGGRCGRLPLHAEAHDGGAGSPRPARRAACARDPARRLRADAVLVLGPAARAADHDPDARQELEAHDHAGRGVMHEGRVRSGEHERISEGSFRPGSLA